MIELEGNIEKNLHSLSLEDIEIQNPEELVLAKQLLRFDDVLFGITNTNDTIIMLFIDCIKIDLCIDVAEDLYPNKLCDYIYELSQKFNQFYESCPVLKAENKEIQQSRAVLCSLTADVLDLSLGLLGIKTVEKL